MFGHRTFILRPCGPEGLGPRFHKTMNPSKECTQGPEPSSLRITGPRIKSQFLKFWYLKSLDFRSQPWHAWNISEIGQPGPRMPETYGPMSWDSGILSFPEVQGPVLIILESNQRVAVTEPTSGPDKKETMAYAWVEFVLCHQEEVSSHFRSLKSPKTPLAPRAPAVSQAK